MFMSKMLPIKIFVFLILIVSPLKKQNGILPSIKIP